VSDHVAPREAEEWECAACGIPLEMAKVEVGYMGSKYPVNLPRCPRCGLVFVPEQLALGKMAEVEKLLEDK
jgi:hypothetical protein